MTCQDFDQVAAELALGAVDGETRARALAHLDSCERCRRESAMLAATLDRLLEAGPCVEPPAGFESSVLAALPLAAPVPLRRRRSARLLLAVAAVVVLLAGVGIGAWIARPGPAGPPATRVAAMVTDQGASMGKVEIGRSPSTVLVALNTWYEPGRSYQLYVRTTDGARHEVGPVVLDRHGVWSGALPVDPRTVSEVQMLDDSGRTLCHATLPA